MVCLHRKWRDFLRVKIAYFVKATIQTDTILSLFSCSEPASSVGENRVQGPDVLEELTPTGNQNSLLIQSHLPIAGEFNDYIIKRMYLHSCLSTWLQHWSPVDCWRFKYCNVMYCTDDWNWRGNVLCFMNVTLQRGRGVSGECWVVLEVDVVFHENQ